jgi:hypothetical protein
VGADDSRIAGDGLKTIVYALTPLFNAKSLLECRALMEWICVSMRWPSPGSGEQWNSQPA